MAITCLKALDLNGTFGTDNYQNLPKFIYICVGAKVMLTINLCTRFGLTNGAECR